MNQYLITYKKQFLFSWLYIKRFTKEIKAINKKKAYVKALNWSNISQGNLLSGNWAVEVELMLVNVKIS